MKISKHFNTSEFKNVYPHPDLIFLLERIREEAGLAVKITDSTRSPKEHVDTYIKLSRDKKIKTAENGLGLKSIMESIPWDSRHLPTFAEVPVKNKVNIEYQTIAKAPYLRAVDFMIIGKNGVPLSGEDIKKIVLKIRTPDINIGLGVGRTYCHLDIGRITDAEWKYGY